MTNKLNVNMSIPDVSVDSLFQSQKQTSSNSLWGAIKDVIRRSLVPLTSKYFSDLLIWKNVLFPQWSNQPHENLSTMKRKLEFILKYSLEHR